MQEIIAALISFILIEPMQAYIPQWYAEADLPAQAAAEAASCFSKATPAILERAGSDPAWAARHAIGYWTGTSTVDVILADVAPRCAVAVEQTQNAAARAL